MPTRRGIGPIPRAPYRLFCDRTHGVPIVPGGRVFPFELVFLEEHVPGVGWGIRPDGRGPVAAIGDRVIDAGILAVTCCGEEDVLSAG